MSRTKKFFKNTIFTGMHQMILMVSGFIIVRVILKYYGSETNGLVNSLKQFFSYFRLVEAGLSGAAIFSLYKPIANKDTYSINRIISASKEFYYKAGYIFVVLTIMLAIIYPLYIRSDLYSSFEIGLIVILLGVNGFIDFFLLSKYRVLLTADQKTYVISIAQSIYLILYTLILAIFSQLHIKIVLLLFIAIISVFVRSLILIYYVRKNYDYLKYNENPDYEALSKRWDALYLQILGIIHTGAPVLILTIVSKNLMLVSVFTVYNMVLSGVSHILSIFLSGLPAGFGEVIAKGEIKILQKSFSEFQLMFNMLTSALYGTLLVMIMPFIQIYTKNITDINYNVPLFGILFVINGLLHSMKVPQGMLVISAGHFKETRTQTTIQALIIVLGGIILAPKFGIVGVLLSSIFASIYRNIDLMFYISKKVTKLPVIITTKRNALILFCMSFNIPLFIFYKKSIGSYIDLLVMSSIIFIFNLIVVLIIYYLFDKLIFLNSIKRFLKIAKFRIKLT